MEKHTVDIFNLQNINFINVYQMITGVLKLKKFLKSQRAVKPHHLSLISNKWQYLEIYQYTAG